MKSFWLSIVSKIRISACAIVIALLPGEKLLIGNEFSLELNRSLFLATYANYADSLTIMISFDIFSQLVTKYDNYPQIFRSAPGRDNERKTIQPEQIFLPANSYKVIKRMRIAPLAIHSLFRWQNELFLHGRKYDQKLKRTNVKFINLSNGQLKLNTALLSSFFLIQERPNAYIGLKRNQPGLFLHLDRNLKPKETIQLQEKIFPLRVWPVNERQYLLQLLPFNSAQLFCLIDKSGHVENRFINFTAPLESNFRNYLLDNTYQAEYESGIIYTTKIYPSEKELELFKIDLQTGQTEIWKTGIIDFPGGDRLFRQGNILELKKLSLAAVNGIMLTDRAVAVSLTIASYNLPEKKFRHYLYLFSRQGSTVQIVELNAGAIIYYDSLSDLFLSLQENFSSAEENEQCQLNFIQLKR